MYMNKLYCEKIAVKGRVYSFVAANVGRGIVLALALCGMVSAQPDLEVINRTLAIDLVKESDLDGASIEYRRLSLMADNQSARDGYRWLSAYYYLAEENPDVALKILDTVEQRGGKDAWKADLLRAEAAELLNSPGEESFYLNSILDNDNLSVDEKDYVAKKLASALIRQNEYDRAHKTLTEEAKSNEGALAALNKYVNGKDKSPALGGWLGVIPGMGYAYAGEYANMMRSIILNGLFIYGMVDTADDGEWGAFSVITFFEITWYTGSIYGGVDASHRYNRNRKQSLLDAVSGGVIMEPDAGEIPTIQLKFTF